MSLSRVASAFSTKLVSEELLKKSQNFMQEGGGAPGAKKGAAGEKKEEEDKDASYESYAFCAKMSTDAMEIVQNVVQRAKGKSSDAYSMEDSKSETMQMSPLEDTSKSKTAAPDIKKDLVKGGAKKAADKAVDVVAKAAGPAGMVAKAVIGDGLAEAAGEVAGKAYDMFASATRGGGKKSDTAEGPAAEKSSIPTMRG